MLMYKTFIEKAKNILHSRVVDGHCFLLYMDITEFQLVNRYYGIERGNELLAAAEDFLNKIPEVVLFERVFSDQFIMLVVTPKKMDNEDIVSIFDWVSRKFLTEQKKNVPACNLKVSCGIYAMSDDNVVDAIDGANLARKKAKHYNSVNTIMVDHTILEQISQYHEIEHEIEVSLQQKKFIFFLQPKVDLVTGEIIGAEALARRIGCNGEIISPEFFSSIMEANSTITALDTLIFRQVCQHMSERIQKNLPVVRTSVNLSRLHVQNAQTAEILHLIARKYHIPPNLLEFELTETILLEDFSQTKVLIDQLRQYHYHVSIDDFGSGYAGINIWQELDFDTLKLDKVFLSEEEPIKTRNAVIIPDIINIAQRLNIRVLCEGVEQKEQCQYLLRLGCTVVQGFYFSQPVPPEQFYEVYEKQDGHYDLPFKAENENPNSPYEESQNNKQEHRASRKAPAYLLLLACCAMFLITAVISTLVVFRQTVTNLFMDSINNNLDSYISEQAAASDAEIENISDTLGAFATLIEQNPNQEFIEIYVSAINDYDESITVLFSTAEQYEQLKQSGRAQPEDIAYFDRLKNGETVISDVTFSQPLGGIYYIAVGVPVMVDGEFFGALRAIINAEILVSTDEYLSPYGTVEIGFLSDQDGNLIYAGDTDALPADNLFDWVPEEVHPEIRNVLSLEDKIESVYLGRVDGISYYLSVASLENNGWSFVVLFRASTINQIISVLVHHTVWSIITLLIAILLVVVVLVAYLGRSRKKHDRDEQRYLLLEQFSDTVLFDYDCREDIVRFTPNAAQLFRVDDWKRKGVLKYIRTIESIYPGDDSILGNMLCGHAEGDKPEIRVRLKHPTEELFYWCLIQYKYIRDDAGHLVSVIGKIVNIDDQQRHEEYLIEQSLRDGLTHCYNKAATEELITQCIKEDKAGLLIMMDMDNFKNINDSFGHNVGDQVLQYISQCLMRTFRANDIIGRVGGDEMIVYMRKTDSQNIVQQKMQILSKLFEENPITCDVQLAVSAGIARYPLDGHNYEELFQAADQAMYQAKKKGKHQYCFFKKRNSNQ